MGTRYLLDLADVCRRSGYPVIEVEGWQYNARGSGGYDQGRPNHVMVHHTASPPSSDPMNGGGDVDYCAWGHPDSPVGNLYLSRDGTVYVMAGGAANTNGTGIDPCGLTPDDSMNSHSIAIEAGNTGVGEPWPTVQQDSYVALCAALCAAYAIPEGRMHAHREWAPSRKIDPAGESRYATDADMWDMDAFRRDVAGTTPEEPDMTADQARMLSELYQALCVPQPGFVDPQGATLNAAWAALWAEQLIAGDIYRMLVDIQARVSALEA